jgi:hypothetical protein
MDSRSEEHQRNQSFKEEKEKKRRFQIVKLDQRISPSGGNGKGHKSANTSFTVGSIY